MNLKESGDLAQSRKESLGQGNVWPPLCYIWGSVWVAQAGVDIMQEWFALEWLKTAAFLAGLPLTLVWSLRMKRNSAEVKRAGAGAGHSAGAGEGGGWIKLALPGLLLVAVVLILEIIGAVGPFFTPLFRGMVLAVSYVLLGVLIGRPLVFLGLWMFALTTVTWTWYLGYSNVVMDGMGGLSLFVSGWMLRGWGTRGNGVQ